MIGGEFAMNINRQGFESLFMGLDTSVAHVDLCYSSRDILYDVS